jgi:hypothetical protein
MSASALTEPFTPKGVAAFARAKFHWLFLAQFICALLAAIAVAWFFYVRCFPVIQSATENLPSGGQIRYGKLHWEGGSPQTLAEGSFLALDVDAWHSSQYRSTADFQVEFGSESIEVYSLFGYSEFLYPPDDIIEFNRPQLQPLWEAWRSEVLFLIAVAVLVALPLVWWTLATIYFLPVWFIGFFTNRELNLLASWKLSCAALLPGALVMIVGILLYGFGVNLISFLFIFGAHFVLGWIYILFALAFFPRNSSAPSRGNPFDHEKKPGT